MNKMASTLLLASALLFNTAPSQAETQKTSVWKMTYSSLDPDQAAEFCTTILGMERIAIPDPTLAKGRAWVRFPDSGLELHFVDARARYGYEKTEEFYRYMDDLDQNMTVFTTFMDNHGAVLVEDLNPYLQQLTKNNVPFLGPVRRADGVYQLYIEIPGNAYLELDARKTPDSVYPTTTWDKVPFAPLAKTS